MDFSDTIIVYDIKVGSCMNIKGQCHLLTFVQNHSDSAFSIFFFF